MSKQKGNVPPWQAIEEQAHHAYREWPLWLVLRERELTAHLSLRKVHDQTELQRESVRKEKPL